MGDALDAFRDRSMFNLIEPSTGWKVDFVVRRDRPFIVTEFARRFPARNRLLCHRQRVSTPGANRTCAHGSGTHCSFSMFVLVSGLDRGHANDLSTRVTRTKSKQAMFLRVQSNTSSISSLLRKTRRRLARAPT